MTVTDVYLRQGLTPATDVELYPSAPSGPTSHTVTASVLATGAAAVARQMTATRTLSVVAVGLTSATYDLTLAIAPTVTVGGHRLGPLTAAAAAAAAETVLPPIPPAVIPGPPLEPVAVGTAAASPPPPTTPTGGWTPATGRFVPTVVVPIPGATASVSPPHP